MAQIHTHTHREKRWTRRKGVIGGEMKRKRGWGKGKERGREKGFREKGRRGGKIEDKEAKKEGKEKEEMGWNE